MSMLSAQVDRLRELATRCDELQVGTVRAVRVPSDMGSILREAADTIWELRNKCADLVDERERLFRANVEKNNEMLRLVRENAKLRKLALGLKWCSENYGCENLCPLYDKSEPEHCREERLLRELRVEVDG